MRCLLVYDIPDDAARAKVADMCLDYGLERIQYSAFMGDLSPNHQHELFLKIGRRLAGRPANVQLFPICDRDARQRRVLLVTAAPGAAPKAGDLKTAPPLHRRPARRPAAPAARRA